MPIRAKYRPNSSWGVKGSKEAHPISGRRETKIRLECILVQRETKIRLECRLTIRMVYRTKDKTLHLPFGTVNVEI